MNIAGANGRHAYLGGPNSRGQRKTRKLHAGGLRPITLDRLAELLLTGRRRPIQKKRSST
jgi:hypothetical protein